MYRWAEHPGEAELALAGRSPEDVFADAMRALAELLAAEGREEGEPVTRRIELSAPDRPALLAEWLSELVFLADTEGFVPADARDLTVGERSLAATVDGRLAEVSGLVKAVTYHRLSLERADEGWRGTVVLDV